MKELSIASIALLLATGVQAERLSNSIVSWGGANMTDSSIKLVGTGKDGVAFSDTTALTPVSSTFSGPSVYGGYGTSGSGKFGCTVYNTTTAAGNDQIMFSSLKSSGWAAGDTVWAIALFNLGGNCNIDKMQLVTSVGYRSTNSTAFIVKSGDGNYYVSAMSPPSNLPYDTTKITASLTWYAFDPNTRVIGSSVPNNVAMNVTMAGVYMSGVAPGTDTSIVLNEFSVTGTVTTEPLIIGMLGPGEQVTLLGSRFRRT